MLDERVGKPIQHENCVGRVRKSWKKSLIGIKLSSNTKFPHPTRFSIFPQILRSAKPIQHFIQHRKNAMLDEMLDWFASAFNIPFKKCVIKNIFFKTQTSFKSKGRSKPVQHFIQHFFCMFDEILDEKLRVSCDEFSGLHTFIQHSIQHSKIHSFINSNSKQIQNDGENICGACFGCGRNSCIISTNKVLS